MGFRGVAAVPDLSQDLPGIHALTLSSSGAQQERFQSLAYAASPSLRATESDAALLHDVL